MEKAWAQQAGDHTDRSCFRLLRISARPRFTRDTQLLDQGFASADAHELGLKVARNGQVLRRDNSETAGLFALGPLCQGCLWEITVVPEIVHQANEAASSIAALQASRLQTALSQAC
jgi:uncharacterized NAD(P)/FAD-binding protein YdhS